MAHGFAVSIQIDGSTLPDSMTPEEAEGSCHTTRPSKDVTVFVESSRRQGFVHSSFENEWVMAIIGESYSGSPITEKIKAALNICTSNQELLVKSLSSLEGQYCCVCFNVRTRLLIRFSDPSGLRPLFFTIVGRRMIVASSLYCLRMSMPKTSFSPDEVNQQFLFQYGYSLSGHTVYEGVKEMAPAQIVLGHVAEPVTDIVWKYINIKPQSKQPSFANGIHSKDIERQLRDCLNSACQHQLGKAEKAAVLLGGFDSALVTSLLHRLGAQVETYSFHYQDEAYNQPYADMLAEYFGIKHNWVHIDSSVVLDGFQKYSNMANWPSMWLHYIIQTQYLCERIESDGMQVCFSGDGCDSAFLGYPSTHKRGRVYKNIPRFSPFISGLFANMIHMSRMEYYFGHVARVLLSMLDAATLSPVERPLFSFQLFGPGSYKRLTGRRSVQYDAINDHFERLLDSTRGQTFERNMYFAKSLISPNRCKLVSASDSSGMRMESPYLYPAVKHFADSLPEAALRPANNIAGKEGKHILMSMAKNERLLPDEIIFQPKLAAIKAPLDRWIASDLNIAAMDTLQSLPFKPNIKYLRSLTSEHLPEKIYKNRFSSDGVVGLAASLLITYASYFK